jgi:hypothetical protein
MGSAIFLEVPEIVAIAKLIISLSRKMALFFHSF